MKSNRCNIKIDESFWNSCIGSFVEIKNKNIHRQRKQKDIFSIKKRCSLPISVGYSNLALASIADNIEIECASTSSTINNINNINNDEVCVKIVIVGKNSENVFYISRLYNIYDQNIDDKWISKDKAIETINEWNRKYPNCEVTVHINKQDEEKNCLDFDVCNKNRISPRSPREKESKGGGITYKSKIQRSYSNAIERVKQIERTIKESDLLR